jgi:hypothetical protein
MSGRPVQFLTAAALAVAASFVSVSAASASCYSGCGYSYSYSYSYAAPVVQYAAPVVYSYSYAAPVTYAPSCNCGYAASAPMYVVNQGPAYAAPVTIEAEPTPAYEGGYRRAYPYYAGGGTRWHRHRWYRGEGYRGHGLGYRARGFGYRHHGYRHGAVVPGRRFAMRHPMVGPGGIHRRHWHGAVGPRAIHRGGMHGAMHRMHGPRHGGGMKPGVVHPMGGPKKKMMP